MLGLVKPLVGIIAFLSAVQAFPSGGLTFSANPSFLAKKTLFNVDDISDQGHKDKLNQGLKDAVTIAAKLLEKMDDPKHTDKLAGWFGSEHSDANARMTIKNVFNNFVGDNVDGTGAGVLGRVHVYQDDYWVPTGAQLPGAGDGTTPFCSLTKDGKSGTAYFKSRDKVPAMHYCDKVWPRGDLAALTANSCSSLGTVMDSSVMTSKFIGANVLHEFMHYPSVGKSAVGSQIVDYAYDAFNCRQLALNTDVNQRLKTINNADTYVWYTLHVALEELCGHSFDYPAAATNNDPGDPDFPDSDPESDDTPLGECNCNENGCTSDSPACCANGTCPPLASQCNCNENGCTSASPDCCANGTCPT